MPMSSNGIFVKATRIIALQLIPKDSTAQTTIANSNVNFINSIEKPLKTLLAKTQSEKLIKFDEFDPLPNNG